MLSFSARAYVQMARDAGFQVIAIDAFADADTQAMAKQTLVAEYDADGFVAEHVIRLLESIDTSQIYGLMYGSGVESRPHLLQAIAQRFRLLGNAADIVQRCKSLQFFDLLNQLNIPFPPINLQATSTQSVLLKRVDGSGGTHIRRVAASQIPQSNHSYIQQEIIGDTLGILFVADAQRAVLIGMHQQWNVALANQAMCASRMMSQVKVSAAVSAQVQQMVQKLTQALGLRGINSLDVIVQDEQVYCLELNPRLSASIDLYRTEYPLMQWHLAGLIDGYLDKLPQQIKQAKTARARQIIYADIDMHILAGEWPEWVTDIPCEGTVIHTNQPLCTVHAHGEDTLQAQTLLEQRIQILSEWHLCQPISGRMCESVS